MRAHLPLLVTRDLDAPFAWSHGRPISGRRFLGDVAAQAQAMPADGAIVNLCRDRYRFAVGLGAALRRGRLSLFPPNALPETLARLADAAGPVHLLADEPFDAGGLPLLPLLQPASERDADEVHALPADLAAACLLTSGSTGAPQPHVKDWRTLTRNVGAAAHRLAQSCGRADLRGFNIVATVPPQHSYGFESTVLLAMLGGAAFDAGRPFFPADIAVALAAVPRPRALVITPFHLRALLSSDAPLPPVDLVLSATAPLSPQLAQRCEQRLGGPLIEIYGCTEAGQVASRRTAATDVWETFGELAITREATADPEIDRFSVHGGHVATPTTLADVLELRDARRFRLLGRVGDVVHVAGKRSSLSHLNYHLNSLEGVEDGAFWMPPERADEVVRLVAFVVAPGLAEAQVLAGLRERIEPQFLPRRIVALDALPRTATGKLTDHDLRALAGAHGVGPAR